MWKCLCDSMLVRVCCDSWIKKTAKWFSFFLESLKLIRRLLHVEWKRSHLIMKGLTEKKKTIPNSSYQELIQEEPHGIAGYNGHFPELGWGEFSRHPGHTVGGRPLRRLWRLLMLSRPRLKLKETLKVCVSWCSTDLSGTKPGLFHWKTR